MMNLLIPIFLLLSSTSQNDLYQTSRLSFSTGMSNEVVVERRSKKGIKKWKVRWKRVFRPIYIFKKRVAFWLGISTGVLLIMSLLGLLAERYNYEWSWTSVNTDGTYLLAGTYLFSLFVTLFLLLWIPAVWIYRIFQELRWKDRFSRCFGFRKF